MWDFPSQKASYPPVNQPHKRRTRRSPARNASTASENEVMKHSIRGPGPTPSWDWYGFMRFPWKLCISPVFIHRQLEQHDIEWIIGWNLSPSPHTSRGSKVALENGRAPWGNASSNTKGASEPLTQFPQIMVQSPSHMYVFVLFDFFVCTAIVCQLPSPPFVSTTRSTLCSLGRIQFLAHWKVKGRKIRSTQLICPLLPSGN